MLVIELVPSNLQECKRQGLKVIDRSFQRGDDRQHGKQRVFFLGIEAAALVGNGSIMLQLLDLE
jgi:hypothetical protein